ncbi:MAG TPA: tetratricopeptide repeat protein [Candidatus Obscuribacter sp.]|nr:tetratricopeptide repeat protein [Candidatus Obscuribacter sp.]
MTIYRKTQVVQGAALAFLLSINLPALAIVSTASYDLSSLETTVLGRPQNELSSLKRLEKLELKLFGKTSQGPESERLKAIAGAVSYGKSGGSLTAQAGRLDKVVPEAAPLAEVDDGSEALAEALSLYNQGFKSQAESKLTALSYSHPGFDVYFNLGVIAETDGKLNEALNYYERARSFKKDDPEVIEAVVSLKSKLAATPKTTDSNWTAAAPPVAPAIARAASRPAPQPTYSEPAGTLTPFSNSRSEEFASGNFEERASGITSSAGYLDGRLKRVITYGLTGAAGAALVNSLSPGRSRSSMGNAALRGALVGSFIGLVTGR